MWRTPTYSLMGKTPAEVTSENPEILDYVKFVFSASGIEWAVAAPDERSMHKYNENSYLLTAYHQSNFMDASTTYTLPDWMGRYHGMLDK